MEVGSDDRCFDKLWLVGRSNLYCCLMQFSSLVVSLLDAHRRMFVVGEFFEGVFGEANLYRFVTHGFHSCFNTVFPQRVSCLLVVLWSPFDFLVNSRFWV